MRRSFLVLGFVSMALALGSQNEAKAQIAGTGVGSDPFSFYYGYYLPHAQYMAAQPTPLDTINRVTANRQVAAAADRQGLYDPISPYGEDELDPLRPYSKKGGSRPVSARTRASTGVPDQHAARGTGPSGHYNRTSQYFPTLRIGRGANQNIAALRGRRGPTSMPSAPSPNGMQTSR